MRYEPLVKLSESLAMDEATGHSVVLGAKQVGSSHSGRGAAHGPHCPRTTIGDGAAWLEAVVGTDLMNAYSRMFRSKAIHSTVKRAPRLVPTLCSRWKPGNAKVWQ